MTRSMLRYLLVVVVVGMMAGITSRVQAVPAVTLDNTTGEALGNPPFTLGFSFTTNQAITVDALGIFDDSQDGLVDSYPIGIWDSVGNLLASTTVDSGTTDPLTNQFRYASISPLALAAGQTYVIGALYVDGNDPLLFAGDAVNFATDPGITFVGSAYVANGSLADPTNTAGADPAYFGPNFIFDATVTNGVPEPSTPILFGVIGLLGLAYVWRRRTANAA